ncbi:Hypothetical predicted protein [Mytilus galloprovincialis]|uniref:Uncharacterized protein n=1 Tax=Mytilus galloprovincialis TaxID=29158 RepID=A0A8B6EYF9_MYTGA|nr:Hypothetical predicted protein [Mytilus galloprovincialis]
MEEKQEDKLNVALEMRQREIHGTIKLPRIKSFSLNRVVTVRGYERSGKRNRMAFRTLHVTNRFVTQLERTVTYCEGPYLDQKDTCFVYVFAESDSSLDSGCIEKAPSTSTRSKTIPKLNVSFPFSKRKTQKKRKRNQDTDTDGEDAIPSKKKTNTPLAKNSKP